MKLRKAFFKIFAPFALVILLAGWYVRHQQVQSSYQSIVDEEHSKLSLKAAYVLNFFDPVISELYYLSRQKILHDFLENPSYKSDLIESYKLFSQTNKSYDQIRVLDNSGKEMIRIDYYAGSVHMVPDSLLQDKSDRPYFKRGLLLQDNEIYLSTVDLNVEYGQIEKPYKPVLRAVMPVFDAAGNRQGFVVTNYLMSRFVRQLLDYYSMKECEFSVLNGNGYWLAGPPRFPVYGFMFDNLQDQHFQHYYPEAWTAIEQQDEGATENDQGLFVFKKLHLLESLQDYNGQKVTPFTPATNNWVLVSHLSPSLLKKRLGERRGTFIIVVAILLMVWAGISWLIARGRAREALRNAEIKAINEALISHEAVLREQTAELTRKNKELEQFAYITSHDLQEPLRMINNFLQLLQLKLGNNLDEEGKEYIRFAVDGAERMRQLILDLLQYSRVANSEDAMGLVDCNEVLEEVRLLLDVVIKETGATIESEQLPVVFGNRTQFVQLFQNLIGNALKYHGEQVPVIRIQANKDGAGYIFAVADNGIGIDPRFFDKIFLIFKRLHGKGKYPGTGVGLAICKKIVENHGGRIWVTSEKGEGSTFWFSIPARTAVTKSNLQNNNTN